MPIDVTHRGSDSPYISRLWRGHLSGATRMTSVASATWELVFWSDGGQPRATVRGPETAARTADVVGDAESFGIIFAHGASLKPLPLAGLVDTQWDSPHASGSVFVLGDDEWTVPGMDDAEALIDRLVRGGLLVRDPLVDDVVRGGPARVGSRSVQRRVAAATGLTPTAIRQIERARAAALLIGENVPALDVVHRCGYYDQPHLARSLQRYIGRTAGRLRREDDSGEPLSFLYASDARGVR